ncbi:MAG TPA: hypothetical protein EYM97_03090 [Gemmatimonadetes bacterium]|nr:hypothetical protein [Gemmatimonadota bacterium]
MAKSKTSTFTLTETVAIPPASPSGPTGRASGTMDIGSLVDVGDQQALSIESCDLIYQLSDDFGGDVENMLQGDGAITTQLSDLNPGGVFVRADDVNLIASGSLNIQDSIATNASDFYPDTFGKLDEARTVVNDQLYIVTGPDVNPSNATVNIYVTVRLRCRIVKLSTKDWMAIAITSVAND